MLTVLAVGSLLPVATLAAGVRGEKALLPIEMPIEAMLAMDSLAQQPSASLALYRLLDSTGAVDKVLRSLPREGRQPDAILFFNGARNLNRACLVDVARHRSIDYIVEGRTLAVVWLDDAPQDRYQIKVRVQRRKNSFVQDLVTIGGAAGKLVNPPSGAFGFTEGELPEEFPEYTLTAEYLYTPAPSEIAVTIKQLSHAADTDSLFARGDFDDIVAAGPEGVLFYTRTDVAIRNLDRQHVGLSVGASLVSVNERVISVDPERGEWMSVRGGVEDEWRGKAMLLVYFQLGRTSGWRPAPEFWQRAFFAEFSRRFSVQLGVEISQRPLDRLLAGLGFSATQSIDLVGGLALRNVPDKDRTVPLHDMRSSGGWEDLVPRSYEPRWFFGLAVRASALRRAD